MPSRDSNQGYQGQLITSAYCQQPRKVCGIRFALKTGNIHIQITLKCPDLTVPEVSCSFPSQHKQTHSQYQAEGAI